MMPFHPWVDGDLLHAAAPTSRRSRRSRSSSVPLRNEMELFRDQVPVLPRRTGGVVPRAEGVATWASPTRSACAAALGAAGDGDLVEAVADLDLHVPNELIGRVRTTSAGNAV